MARLSQERVREKRVAVPKALQRSEHDEQVALFDWIGKLGESHPARLAFAIPNFAGHHGTMVSRIVSGKRAKAEGRKAGVPDVFLPVARGGYHGCFVEMKRAHGVPSDVDDAQRAWSVALQGSGYYVAVAFGFEEARQVITDYLNLKGQ